VRKVYSHTKRSVLEKCPLMYFYQYYAATCKPPVRDPQALLFGDDRPDHPPLVASDGEAAGRLSKLDSAPQYAGKILHDLIAQALKHPDWQFPWFEKKARETFLTPRDPEASFVERFNHLPDADQRIKRALDGLLHGLRNFFEDAKIRILVESMRYGEQQLIEHRLGGFPQVRQFSIRGRIDYCAKIGPQVEVIDWKMGRSTGDEDSLQLAVYGIWALKHFGVDPGSVRVRRVFLADARIEEARSLTERRVHRAQARLAQDIEQMAQLHPYGTAGHAGAFTPKPKEKLCEMCKFRTLCPAAAC
jgi:PD-(D/E)XK nuclease superfamily